MGLNTRRKKTWNMEIRNSWNDKPLVKIRKLVRLQKCDSSLFSYKMHIYKKAEGVLIKIWMLKNVILLAVFFQRSAACFLHLQCLKFSTYYHLKVTIIRNNEMTKVTLAGDTLARKFQCQRELCLSRRQPVALSFPVTTGEDSTFSYKHNMSRNNFQFSCSHIQEEKKWN